MKQVTLHTPFITLVVINYGAIIQKILVKDKNGDTRNIVVGFNNPDEYLTDTISLGACVGRYAGRISKGGFELDRVHYDLYQQKGVHLHGGKNGFAKKYWNIEEIQYGNEPFITLSYTSKHLEEGYPGTLKAFVTYKLVNNTLKITHTATTDRTTVVNLTNHSYFQLDNAANLDKYRLQLASSQLVELAPNKLPTGALVSVKETDNDFLEEKAIKKTRFDTVFAIDSNSETVASVASLASGISLKVKTNQPGLVVYTPEDFSAICFETQNFPDAPNQKNFPNSILRPGELYRNDSEFIFDLLP